MPISVTPFCDVIQKVRAGTIVTDFGHCFTERPINQFNNTDYTITGFVQEPNTDTLIVKPSAIIDYENGLDAWNVGGDGDFWEELVLPYLSGTRSMVKWFNAIDNVNYTLHGKTKFASMQPIIFEVGLLPSSGDSSTVAEVDLCMGSYARLLIRKDFSAVFYTGTETGWKEVGEVPLDFESTWRDIGSFLVWMVPYYDGMLFSTDGTYFFFIRDLEDMSIPAYYPVIHGKGGVSAFAVHKVQFAPASIVSGDVEMGTSVSQTAVCRMFGWLKGLGGSYSVVKTVTGEGLYKYTASIIPGVKAMGISRISVNHPPALTINLDDGEIVQDVLEVNETIPEDPSLESCTIRIANEGMQHTGRFHRFDEVWWYFGWLMSDLSILPYPLTTRNHGVITDIQDTRNNSGEYSIELSCKSMLHKLRDSSVISAPDYAGWNVKEALTDFLNRYGIPTSQLDIYAYDLILPEGEKQDRCIWQPEIGDSVWRWIEDIVYYFLGGWIYTKRDGTIRIEPYPEADDAGEFLGDLYTIDASHLSELSYQSREEAIAEIRNIIYVEGRTPAGYPISAILRDDASLYDPTAENFIGYPKALVKRAFYLATQEICNYAVRVLYNRYRKLRKDISFTTDIRSGNYDLYPGRRVEITHASGPSDLLIVRSMTSRIANSEFQQTVYGHYIEAT